MLEVGLGVEDGSINGESTEHAIHVDHLGHLRWQVPAVHQSPKLLTDLLTDGPSRGVIHRHQPSQ
jgi:hypothetical protein